MKRLNPSKKSVFSLFEISSVTDGTSTLRDHFDQTDCSSQKKINALLNTHGPAYKTP